MTQPDFTHLKTGLIKDASKGWGALPNFKENPSTYLPGRLGRTALDSFESDAHRCYHCPCTHWQASVAGSAMELSGEQENSTVSIQDST